MRMHHIDYHPPQSSWLHHRDGGMVQYIQVNKCNLPHKTEKQESNDYLFSLDGEKKIFDKNLTHFHKKVPENPEIQGIYHNLTKVIYTKTTANIIPHGERKKEHLCLFSFILFNIILAILGQ